MVSRADERPILGNRDCRNLNFVDTVKQDQSSLVYSVVQVANQSETIEMFVTKNADAFEGLSTFHRTITILKDVSKKPEMCLPLRYGVSVTDKLKDKLEVLESRGVVAICALECPILHVYSSTAFLFVFFDSAEVLLKICNFSELVISKHFVTNVLCYNS